MKKLIFISVSMVLSVFSNACYDKTTCCLNCEDIKDSDNETSDATDTENNETSDTTDTENNETSDTN